jgi:hypothetical protein
MLGGERQGELFNDVAPKPGLLQTATAAYQKPIEQVQQLGQYIFPGLSTEKTRAESAARLATINETLNDPRQGFGQQTVNTISSIVGGLLPTAPLAIAGGVVGAGVAGAIGFGARELALDLASENALARYLATQVPIKNLVPEAVSHFAPKASIGAVVTGLTEGYTAYKGYIIPEHFAEHYNAVENSLDATHAIQDWGSDNYGFLLGAAPLAAGYILSKGIKGTISFRKAAIAKVEAEAESARLHAEHQKVLKENEIKAGEVASREAKVSELHLQQAEDQSLISSDMHKWYLDYLENPNDPKVHEGGLKILQDLQIPYDRVTGRVWNQVLSRDAVQNVKSALFDQHLTSFTEEENQLLSSYIVHNELDGYIATMRENPNLLHAMDGFTHSLGLKIEAHSKALKAMDFALSKELPEGIRKRHIMSQRKIYYVLKEFQEATGEVVKRQSIPFHVPKDVMLKLRLAHQIRMIKGQSNAKYKRLFAKGEDVALQEKLDAISFRHPGEELLDIKEKLMPEGKLISDFKNRAAYHRLEDLSQVSGHAQVLLDRIHMEAINAKQAGLNNVLKKFLDMVDSNSSRLADPSSVKRYLSSRIEKSVPNGTKLAENGIEFKEYLKEQKTALGTAQKPEVLYDEAAKERVSRSEFKEAVEHYESSEKRFKQFTENEQALSDLIKCALGE